MSEIVFWSFLVSCNQFLDYRTVVAPDFMCEANTAGLLAKVTEGETTDQHSAYYREILGSKVGDLTIIYQIVEAQAKDISNENEGVLKDSFGREIYLIEGIVVKGLQNQLSLTLEDLELNHQELINAYRDFWEWVSPQPAISSESSTLEEKSDTPTLELINLENYIAGNNTLSLSKSIIFSISKDTQKIPFDKRFLNGEVHQCYFLNDKELILYIRPNSLSPHNHKVVKLFIDSPDKEEVLIEGTFKDRSIEGMFLDFEKEFIVTSNKKLSIPFICPWFLNVLYISNKSNKNDNKIYDGGDEKIAITKDCKWIVNAYDHSIELVDISGSGSIPFPSERNKKITCISTSPYENVLASGDEGGMIRLWTSSPLSLYIIDEVQAYVQKSVDALAFSPCKKLFVSTGNKGEIKLIDYKNNKVNKDSEKYLGKHFGNNKRACKVNALSFSPDGRTIASAGDDGSIRIWNVEKGENQDAELLSEHNQAVMSVNFSPDGNSLVSGSKDKTIKIWHLDKG